MTRSARRRQAPPPSIVTIGLLALLLACSTTAAADTIYLKNGRVIHTQAARIDGGMLVFSQHGGTVSIPMSAVARVERDENVEESAAEPAAVVVAPSAPRDREETGPWDRVEYWAERLVDIDERIERVEGELDRLPFYSAVDQRLIISGQIMYFVAERARWEKIHADLLTLRKALERGARKAGIAPGALREARQRR